MWRTTPTPSLDLLNNAQDPAAPPEVPEGAEGVAAPAAAAGVLEGVAAPGALGVEGVLSVDTTEVRGPRIRIIKIELFHSSEGRRSNLKRSPLFFLLLGGLASTPTDEVLLLVLDLQHLSLDGLLGDGTRVDGDLSPSAL